MAETRLTVNGQTVQVEADEDTPLLWILREELGFNGVKYGCGAGLCGACSVMVDGILVRSCVTPLMSVEGAEVLTIEGLSEDGSHPVQRAWIEEQVPQCGYCQSGMIMAALSLLQENPDPSDEDIDAAMTNICRCGTYPRVRRAIKKAAKMSVRQ